MSCLQTAREESFDSVYSSEISGESFEENTSTENEMDADDAEPSFLTVKDVQRVVHPLQEAADRVGRQVERFAETLDRLTAETKTQPNDCRRALPMVCEYEKIAAETVKRLKRYHDPERQERLRGSWRRKLHRGSRTPTPPRKSRQVQEEGFGATTVEDLHRWEQEYQTWQLVRLLLQTQYPVKNGPDPLPDQEAKFQRPRENIYVHRYSSERDVWRAFLADFEDVWEKNVVVEWLRTSADSSGQEIGSVIEQLEKSADRGSGLSAHGWLYSKEAIKAQKRLRSWPQPIESGSPGIEASLVSKDHKEALVTQLDPDAFSRQARSLEAEDVFFERATWLGCWEMLRRGQNWETIRDFCQERIEGWRALSLRGDPRMLDSDKIGPVATQGAQSRILWRKMCLNAAKEGGIDDYESAVYGFLSGDFASMSKVTRTWNDHLLALYNSQLITQFDFYVQRKFANRIPETIDPKTRKMFFDEIRPSNLTGNEAYQSLLTNEYTKAEAKEPFKMIQGSLIAHKFARCVESIGLALGPDAIPAAVEMEEDEPMIDPGGPAASTFIAAQALTHDHDLLRLLVHIILAFHSLEVIKAGDAGAENIISAYITFLSLAGKQDMLPLYASFLSPQRAKEAMARQLPAIVEAAERRRIFNLMVEYDLDVSQILREQLIMLANGFDEISQRDQPFAKLDMLTYIPRERYTVPAIKPGFLGEEIADEHWDLIHALEWFLLLEGQWPETMWAGALVYKVLLSEGAFAAASEVSRRVSFSTISLDKTRAIFGRQIDLSGEKPDEQHEGYEYYDEVMLSSSNTFRGLENLVTALNAISHWKMIADQLKEQKDPRHAREYKSELQDAHDAVTSAIEPLMHNWLQEPADETEGLLLTSIKQSYLPDLLTAYISILHFDGHHLSRDYMLKIMNLAIEIAGPSGHINDTKNVFDPEALPGLTEVCATFQRAGRMSQLMDTFTAASMSVLVAEEANVNGAGFGGVRKRGGKKGKRDKGENLDVWSVKFG